MYNILINLQAGLSRDTLRIYYKVSSKSHILLPTSQELNKESLSLVYKIWVGAASGNKQVQVLQAADF